MKAFAVAEGFSGQLGRMQINIHAVWPWPIVVAVAVGLVVFSFWTYTRQIPARRWLLTLRMIAIAIAVFALLRPSLVFTKTLKQSSVLVMLADRSKSMMLKDEWDNQSRWRL